MNRGKVLGFLVLALFLVIVLGCGRKAPPSLPQKPSSSVHMASKELHNSSDSFYTITPLNGCYAGFSLASGGNEAPRSELRGIASGTCLRVKATARQVAPKPKPPSR